MVWRSPERGHLQPCDCDHVTVTMWLWPCKQSPKSLCNSHYWFHSTSIFLTLFILETMSKQSHSPALKLPAQDTQKTYSVTLHWWHKDTILLLLHWGVRNNFAVKTSRVSGSHSSTPFAKCQWVTGITELQSLLYRRVTMCIHITNDLSKSKSVSHSLGQMPCSQRSTKRLLGFKPVTFTQK